MTNRPERTNEIDQARDGTSESLPERYGRRALILGATATGAGVAASLGGGRLAEAAPNSSHPVLLGKPNATSGTTNVTSSKGSGIAGHSATAAASGVSGFDTSKGKKGFGVFGHSVNGTAVNGISMHGNGVVGNTFTVGSSGVAGIDFCPTKGAHGVYGQSNVGDAVLGVSLGGTGVTGYAGTPGESGVAGIDAAPAGGHGVFAQSQNGNALYATSSDGIALRGQSANGLALQVQGKAQFGHSGVTSVPAGEKTTTVTVPSMIASDFVLATIQQPQSGVFIEGAQPSIGSFTITLSTAATFPLPVAWLVLST